MEMNELLSVSNGDALPVSPSVSDGDIAVLDKLEEIRTQLEATLSTETETEGFTLWNKPLAEYTVSEGLLLIIAVLLLWLVISRFIGGIFK